jgi:hypothetical protein
MFTGKKCEGHYSAGVTQYRFSGIESVWSWGEDELTRTYRVEREKIGEDLKLVLIHTTEPPSWPCVTILLPVATFLGVYWLVRRSLRRPPPRLRPFR